MSNEYNEAILENLFEEGLELYKGDEKKAEKYARKKFEDLPEPDYKAEGGEAISDADIASVRRAFRSQDFGQGGRGISNADMARLQRFMTQETGNMPRSLSRRNKRRLMQETGNTISNADIARIMRSIGMEDGGEAVPAKFKGFSKLPEKVQQKMDPDLAQKYEKGGAVGSCRGMGAALRGGRFSGVK